MGSLIVGIAGGTGSGKTTIARTLANLLPQAGVAVIEYDAYYRDRGGLSPEAKAQVNFDHPDALESDLLVEHLDALRDGRGVDVPVYDFKTNRRHTESRRVDATPIVVVEGILMFV